MKEEIIQELITIIQSTKSFTLEHAPDVCREIILLGRVKFGIYSVGLLLSLLLINKAKDFWKKHLLWREGGGAESYKYKYHDFYTFYCAVTGFILSVLFLVVCMKYCVAIVAPKLYLLQQLRSLL